MNKNSILDRPFYVSIESTVLLDQDLTNTDKIVYGVISVFSMNKDGYCYLRKNKIAELCNIKKRQLLYCLTRLIKKQYLIRKIVNDKVYLMPTTNAVIRMREEKKIPVEFFDYDWLNEE